IEFFDFFHPQISDPGAYVTVHKEKEVLKYELANYGWSSEWKTIDKDSLTNYIYKNRPHNDGRIKMVARLKCTIEVPTEKGIVITPMFYKLDDKN
ncbi:MAG: hypothetical protein H7X71_06730, partial [Chitinophagales bacterium]|nr:hypothetical protein [Chitinophagales bacterium]